MKKNPAILINLFLPMAQQRNLLYFFPDFIAFTFFTEEFSTKFRYVSESHASKAILPSSLL